jgi:hypothetical protein
MLPLGVWRLVLACVLAVAIFLSAYARAPHRAIARGDLARLVLCALTLYAIGVAASITGHPALAGVVYALGIGLCAYAVWLSRGSDSDDPPDDEDPVDERPPPDPDGVPWCDWADFERAFRAYVERRHGREPAAFR